MKISMIVLSVSLASFAFSQSSELKIYELDTKEHITACTVTAYVDNLYTDQGYIESINGSIITLHIASNTNYLIHINDTKSFEIKASNEVAVALTTGKIKE